jgi:hypothetical protein
MDGPTAAPTEPVAVVSPVSPTEPGSVLPDPVPPVAAQPGLGSLVMGGSVTVRCQKIGTTSYRLGESIRTTEYYSAVATVPGLTDENFVSARTVDNAGYDPCEGLDECTFEGETEPPISYFFALREGKLYRTCGQLVSVDGTLVAPNPMIEGEVTFHYNYRVN